MIRRHIWIFVIVLIMIIVVNVVLFSPSVPSNGEKRPTVSNGILDLRQWNFEKKGNVHLDGKWQFYGGQLLEPNTDWDSSSLNVSYVDVPKSWNKFADEPSVSSGLGYGTYRLIIQVPEDLGTLAIRLSNISSSYKLWVNGRLLAKAGQVSTDPAHSKAEQYPRIVSFEVEDGRAEIVLQVSNYKNRKGGVWSNLLLGTTQQVTRVEILAVAKELLIIGSLLIIGTYHIGLYAFRRRERFTMPFGLLCLVVALRMSVTGEAILFQRFPNLSWELGLRLEYVAFALSGVTGYTYLLRMFPQDGSRSFYRLSNVFGFVLTAGASLLPTLTFTRLLPVYQAYVIVVCAACVYVVIKARLRKVESSTLVLTGLLIFIATIIYDMLIYKYVFFQLVPIGITFFVLMQSLILSKRFTHALRKVELVSDELRELNMHLEIRVEERTNALRQSNQSLEQSNKELERLEKSRRHLLSNISHDLRTPMTLVQGYLEAMRDGLIEDKEMMRKHMNMMLDKLSRLNGLIDDLFELSKLEAGQVRFHFEKVSVRGWLESVQLSFETDVEKDGGRLLCRYEGDTVSGDDLSGNVEVHASGSKEPVVWIDLARMEQVMANLIYNALRYLPDNDADKLITVDAVIDQQTAVIEITDSGSGIDEEDLPFIFDRFYKKDKSRNSSEAGSGLGLAIVKEIVLQHGGSIEARNKEGAGASFQIRLPLAVS
ncbi:ATP-binding protein [Paenibacillus xylaniclasticus]|uniref:ATP-binding protein n=1 Tax=Paenibacillus xylaniclasticus TaxID=588083 RepID=UPI0013E00E40|nr:MULTISPECIES: ATP-binding protein [Paenibacillus]GFN30736.1 histidine kinase [Paenibacillus curdlanolyticus]